MSQKNITAITRGALVAKLHFAQKLKEGGLNRPTLEMLEKGNRAMRRVAARQRRKDACK